MKVNIKIQPIQRDDYEYGFKLPSYATEGSAGMDLFACLRKEVIINPGDIKSIPTGIAIHIADNNIGGFIFPRSGLSTKHGISLVNSVGVIDSDYTGEVICPMINHSNAEYVLKPGDRIAQIIFMPIYIANFILTEELEDTKRGSGGFGSTGR